MASFSHSSPVVLLLVAHCGLLLALAHGYPPTSPTGSALSSTFYDASCPSAYDVVRRVIQDARVSDPRIPASLIRLHFHDCFVNVSTNTPRCALPVWLIDRYQHALHHRSFDLTCTAKCFQGCDGSLLLDDDLPAIQTEKNVPGNDKSARGFPVVDDIKAALEHACPGIVSCADILALAAEISVELCQFTRENCTAGQPKGALENLDQTTPNLFDNKYYGNLVQGRAQLPSDQVMLSDPSASTTTAPIVHRFAGNQQDFFRNFGASMIKMGNISPLTGNNGEIRKNCRRVNSKGY
ncbi:hypothetical protein HU200_002716 [Digitaria exilis]|uniref:Peroxidase n=1 Tax=Digitaria exilis TaxID=1010633 RepID=A0A835KZ29_9POAL|nr:hypothetical protein HU200_002716 [Digitaria exilis]